MKPPTPGSLLIALFFLLISGPVSAQAPPAPSKQMQEANTFYQSGRWAEARAAYETVVASEPDNSQAWYRLGVSRQSLEDFNGALEAYQKCIALQPGQSFAMYNAACASARLDRKTEAIEWLRKSVDAGFPGGRGISTDEDLKRLYGEPGFQEVMKTVTASVTPCLAAPEYNQFDFWVGEWDVQNQQGQPVGTSSVQKLVDGCLILENWTDGFGGSGKSMNYYSPITRKWRQNWVGSAGGSLDYVGEYSDGVLRYEGEKTSTDGSRSLDRLTFFNLGPDRVRQLHEQSNDQGKTWSVTYDFTYLRRK